VVWWERRRDIVAPGEVLISIPDRQASWRHDAAGATLAHVERRAGPRWHVERLDMQLDDPPSQGIYRLRRQYVCLTSRPGFEPDVMRVFKVAAWRDRLELGPDGVHVVRAPTVRPTSDDVVPLGQIHFTEHHAKAKQVAGFVGGESAAGVDIVVIDLDPADPTYLDPSLEVKTTTAENLTVRDGHGTLVTAVVADVARGARIRSVGIGRAEGRTTGTVWPLLTAVVEERRADLIVASLSIVDTGSAESRERTQYMRTWLHDVTMSALRPIVLCPTGNHAPGYGDIDTIDVPARLEGATAIGAVDVTYRRAATSRYGKVEGSQASRWWVAPGGSFGDSGPEQALVTVSDEAQAGTSVANAFAGGVMAVLLSRLRQERSALAVSNEKALAIESAHQIALDFAARDDPDKFEAQRQVADDQRAQALGALTRFQLLEALKANAEASRAWLAEPYDCAHHGLGLVCLRPSSPAS
jgi:hypothetical protein